MYQRCTGCGAVYPEPPSSGPALGPCLLCHGTAFETFSEVPRLYFETWCLRCNRVILKGEFPNFLGNCQHCGGTVFSVKAVNGPESSEHAWLREEARQ